MRDTLFLSTDMVDATIRDEFWRNVSSALYEVDPWNDDDRAGLIGSIGSRPFGSMIVGSTTFNEQKCRRSRQIVTRSALEMCVVQLVLAGEAQGDFNGVDASIKLGDILIHDLTQVMDAQLTAGARLSIVVARSELQRHVSRNTLHGIVLRSENPRTRLLSHYMIGLDKVLGDLQQEAIPAAQEALLILLASAINGRDGDVADDIQINLPMRQRIIEYIDRNIADPNLNLQTIMRYFRVSRSHLYRAFEEDGGIAKLIRDKRLDASYRMLMNPGATKLSIKEAMRQSGLPDNGHFAKIFKERFDMLPSEVQEIDAPLPKIRNQPFSLQDYLHEHASRFKLPND